MSRWLTWRARLDRAVATALLVAVAPVIAVCAWLVRRHDGGPAFVRVQRAGRHGRPFEMWKLRTMRVDRPDGTARGPKLTLVDDPRITPIGARLRRWHLDELPQLRNVASGDMLLCGPRPEDPAFVDPSDPCWSEILESPPGIFGPTQLAVGRWELEVLAAAGTGSYQSSILPVKLAIDRWYLSAACPRVDLEIVFSLVRNLRGGSLLPRLRKRITREVPEAAAARLVTLGPVVPTPWPGARSAVP